MRSPGESTRIFGSVLEVSTAKTPDFLSLGWGHQECLRKDWGLVNGKALFDEHTLMDCCKGIPNLYALVIYTYMSVPILHVSHLRQEVVAEGLLDLVPLDPHMQVDVYLCMYICIYTNYIYIHFVYTHYIYIYTLYTIMCIYIYTLHIIYIYTHTIYIYNHIYYIYLYPPTPADARGSA